MKQADKEYVMNFLTAAWGTFIVCFGLSYFITYEDVKFAVLYLGELYYKAASNMAYIPY